MKNMEIAHVGMSTSATIFNPARAFEIADAVNRKIDDRKMDVEVYAIPPRLITNHLKPAMVVTPERLDYLERNMDAKTARIHPSWMPNWREIGYQAIFGDWYASLPMRGREVALMALVGGAAYNFGTLLAHKLDVPMSMHPNVSACYRAEGKFQKVRNAVKRLLAENSIAFNSLYQSNRDVLGDPVATIQHEIVEMGKKGLGMDGFQYGIDHKFGLVRNNNPDFLKEKVTEVIMDFENPLIQQYTEVAHVASPDHDKTEIGDPYMKTILEAMVRTPFGHPVSITLDFHPQKFMAMSFQQQVDYFEGFRDWVLDLHAQAN